ncbi:MAG: hypothetical protein LBT78_12110 [Tannerella sp.]|jgi:hypothetical protein|nr:hypothetical protein [Tannerella sp.]
MSDFLYKYIFIHIRRFGAQKGERPYTVLEICVLSVTSPPLPGTSHAVLKIQLIPYKETGKSVPKSWDGFRKFRKRRRGVGEERDLLLTST